MMLHYLTARKSPKKVNFIKCFPFPLFRHFEIVTFTAGHRKYASALLNAIDPASNLIQHRIYRDCCYIASGSRYIKNLNILGRDLDHTLIVDNCLEAFGFQMDNGILVRSWFDDPEDDELMKLLTLLKEMVDKSEKAQDFVKRTFDNAKRFSALHEA
jgi:CTD small phosphatase-like protein 2